MEEKVNKLHEDEIIETLLDELESDILKDKLEIQKLGSNCLGIIAKGPIDYYGNLPNESMNTLEEMSKDYKLKVSEINKKIRFYKSIKNNIVQFDWFFKDWIDREISMMNVTIAYINENFTRKELDKEEK